MLWAQHVSLITFQIYASSGGEVHNCQVWVQDVLFTLRQHERYWLVTAVQRILKDHHLPVMQREGKDLLWLNFAEKALEFEKKIAPLMGLKSEAGGPLARYPWRNGSCFAAICSVKVRPTEFLSTSLSYHLDLDLHHNFLARLWWLYLSDQPRRKIFRLHKDMLWAMDTDSSIAEFMLGITIILLSTQFAIRKSRWNLAPDLQYLRTCYLSNRVSAVWIETICSDCLWEHRSGRSSQKLNSLCCTENLFCWSASVHHRTFSKWIAHGSLKTHYDKVNYSLQERASCLESMLLSRIVFTWHDISTDTAIQRERTSYTLVNGFLKLFSQFQDWRESWWRAERAEASGEVELVMQGDNTWKATHLIRGHQLAEDLDNEPGRYICQVQNLAKSFFGNSYSIWSGYLVYLLHRIWKLVTTHLWSMYSHVVFFWWSRLAGNVNAIARVEDFFREPELNIVFISQILCVMFLFLSMVRGLAMWHIVWFSLFLSVQQPIIGHQFSMWEA